MPIKKKKICIMSLSILSKCSFYDSTMLCANVALWAVQNRVFFRPFFDLFGRTVALSKVRSLQSPRVKSLLSLGFSKLENNPKHGGRQQKQRKFWAWQVSFVRCPDGFPRRVGSELPLSCSLHGCSGRMQSVFGFAH